MGKSLLFNRLCGRRASIVHNAPGMTLDYLSETAKLATGQAVRLIDTGGICGEENEWTETIMRRMKIILRQADIVLLMTDAVVGLHHGDKAILSDLRRHSPDLPRLLLANKSEGKSAAIVCADFYALGEEVLAVSAKRGSGVEALRQRLIQLSTVDSNVDDDADNKPAATETKKIDSETETESAVSGNIITTVTDVQEVPLEENRDEKKRVRKNYDGDNREVDNNGGLAIAIIGRPNVGKSTLMNRFLREDRVLVSPKPGTTRDNIRATLSSGGKTFLLIDTAGMGRRRASAEREKLIVSAARDILQQAAAVFFMYDMSTGISRQDKRLATMIADAGCGAVVVANKSDMLPIEGRRQLLRSQITDLPLGFEVQSFAVSAIHGKLPMSALLAAAGKAILAAQTQFSTAQLNRALIAAVGRNNPPMSGGVRPKLRFAHQGGRSPLRIIIHGGGVTRIGDDYRRYLSAALARELSLSGAPLHIDFRAEENPYV